VASKAHKQIKNNKEKQREGGAKVSSHSQVGNGEPKKQ